MDKLVISFKKHIEVLASETMILIELNPHASELIFLTPIPANKMELFRQTINNIRVQTTTLTVFIGSEEMSRLGSRLGSL